jgi:glycogen debranching enzyme
MVPPDRWGQGGIFAYSGLAGRCSYDRGLVGTLMGDGLGILVHKPLRRELRFGLRNVQDLCHEIVASDTLLCRLVERGTGAAARLLTCFANEMCIAGETTPLCLPYAVAEDTSGQAREAAGATLTIHASEPGGSVLAIRASERGVRFAFAVDATSLDGAVSAALAALDTDVDQALAACRAFYSGLPPSPPGTPETWERTLAKCYSIMRSQVYTPEGMFRQRWTTPDRIPHRMIWLWDSAFHSLGNRHISVDLARETLDSVLDMQREDGFVPIMGSPGGEVHEETQPPTLAWAYAELYRFSGRTDFLSTAYPRLVRYLTWNDRNRDANRNDLHEWKLRPNNVKTRCGESGMDNSPRFDNVEPMDCVDFSCFMAKEAESMAAIAQALDRPQEERAWSDRHARICGAIDELLWDEEDGLYYDRTTASGSFRKVRSVASFLPLFAGACGPERARRLAAHLEDPRSFGTLLPVPSIAVSDPTYGTDMWRGPVWINFNYLIVLGLERAGYAELARRIARRTLEVVSFWYEHDGCLYEFYDSADRLSPSRFARKGPNIQPYEIRVRMQCIRDYGWTATLFADLLLRHSPQEVSHGYR